MSRPLLPHQQLDLLVARAIHAGPSKWPPDLAKHVRRLCNENRIQTPNDQELEWFLQDWINGYMDIDTTCWRRAVEAFHTSRHDRKRLLREIDFGQLYEKLSEFRGRKKKRGRVWAGSASATQERMYQPGTHSITVEKFLRKLKGRKQ